jgi:hypothetical protein
MVAGSTSGDGTRGLWGCETRLMTGNADVVDGLVATNMAIPDSKVMKAKTHKYLRYGT